MKSFIKILIFDIILSPITFGSAILLVFIRAIGVQRMKISRTIFFKVGVFPIRDYYYEPFFNSKHMRYSLHENRNLPGFDLNIKEQLSILEKFSYDNELIKYPLSKANNQEFYYHNGYFEAGDAEYLYSMIRFYKPKKIIEIESGHSTLMAINAIKQNKAETLQYSCEHICIEPYEHHWLEKADVKLIRKRVEEVDVSIFSELEPNDILFIDSSHVIRPQGDVLFEYLEILPILNSGVIVHIHDIFTPKDYPEEWLLKKVNFWNEQYLLEAFLSLSNEYKIIGSLNYLKHHYFNELARKCPVLKKEPGCEPGSFWIIKG